jgi:hypothetical protein
MDVYSCRDFEPTAVEQHLASRLGAYDVQVTDLSFALEYETHRPRPSHRRTTRRSGREALRGWSKAAS